MNYVSGTLHLIPLPVPYPIDCLDFRWHIMAIIRQLLPGKLQGFHLIIAQHDVSRHIYIIQAAQLGDKMPMGKAAHGKNFFLRAFHKSKRQNPHQCPVAIIPLPRATAQLRLSSLLVAADCLVGCIAHIKYIIIGSKFRP